MNCRPSLLLLSSLVLASCADNSTPIVQPRVLSRPDISHVQLASDDDANVQRFRQALVGLCVQEPSLALAITPTATKPAHTYPDSNELQIDLWMIDTHEMTFQLMTATEKPIWIVSGSFIEQDGALIADATISELHYQWFDWSPTTLRYNDDEPWVAHEGLENAFWQWLSIRSSSVNPTVELAKTGEGAFETYYPSWH